MDEGSDEKNGTVEASHVTFDSDLPPQSTVEELSEVPQNDVDMDIKVDVDDDDGSSMSVHNNETLQNLYLEDFRDHFTLATPSSLVRFRTSHTAVRVFESKTTQFILEETMDEVTQERRVYAKQLSDGTQGLQFLRATYTIICIFWTGIFFVLCLQIVLVMVLEMAVASGQTELAGTAFVRFIGLIIGILVFSYGFASAMVIASAFVADAWTGHYLVKLFFFKNRYGNVLVDWIFFLFFILFPLSVMCITLLMRREDWWSITMLFWYACVSLFFVVFAVNSVFFEVQGALSFLSKRSGLLRNGFLGLIKQAILISQIVSYSGYQTTKYLARSSALPATMDGTVDEGGIEEWSREERIGIWARITRLRLFSRDSSDSQKPGFLPFFSSVNPPKKLYTIDDVQEHRPFVTKHTWSLERLFCRPRNSRYVVIVDGPGALTDHQMKSSLACGMLGLCMFYALVISLLVYMRLPTWILVAAVCVCVIMSIPLYKDTRRLVRLMKRLFAARAEEERTLIQERAAGDAHGAIKRPDATRQYSTNRRSSEILGEDNDGLLLISQQERITEASDLLCWLGFAVEILFYFIFPLGVLFSLENYKLVVMFIVVGFVSIIRRYINLLTIVEEVGDMKNRIRGTSSKTRWHKQSRLNELIKAISYNKQRRIWLLIILGVAVVWIGIFFFAFGDTGESSDTSELKFVNGFSWTPQPVDVRYPTCELSKSSAFGANANMADYAFLSHLPYISSDIAQAELQEWFNGTNVVEDRDTVQEFRTRSSTSDIPVYFKLYRFPLDNGLDRGVISIRGTQNGWDLLADLQLWSATMLSQGLRVVLPIGEMWTPILDEIIVMMTWFQEAAVRKVSFYKVTTAFAKELKNDPTFENIQLTGHSLGGGIAMISSAQTGTPSVAVSGPNSILSGKSFKPAVLPGELNKYTFNIVPDWDVVPRFDDLAENFQRIKCTADHYSAPLACHSIRRSICELLHTCGNGDRPIPCNCVFEYDYDPPELSDLSETRTFREICEDLDYDFPED